MMIADGGIDVRCLRVLVVELLPLWTFATALGQHIHGEVATWSFAGFDSGSDASRYLIVLIRLYNTAGTFVAAKNSMSEGALFQRSATP